MQDCPLTFRQREILQALGNGQTRKQVAWRYRITPGKVDSHTYDARKRLGTPDNLQAVLTAARRGWILLDGLEATDDIEFTGEHRMMLRRFDSHVRHADIGGERDWCRDLMLDLAEPVDYPPL